MAILTATIEYKLKPISNSENKDATGYPCYQNSEGIQNFEILRVNSVLKYPINLYTINTNDATLTYEAPQNIQHYNVSSKTRLIFYKSTTIDDNNVLFRTEEMLNSAIPPYSIDYIDNGLFDIVKSNIISINTFKRNNTGNGLHFSRVSGTLPKFTLSFTAECDIDEYAYDFKNVPPEVSFLSFDSVIVELNGIVPQNLLCSSSAYMNVGNQKIYANYNNGVYTFDLRNKLTKTYTSATVTIETNYNGNIISQKNYTVNLEKIADDPPVINSVHLSFTGDTNNKHYQHLSSVSYNVSCTKGSNNIRSIVINTPNGTINAANSETTEYIKITKSGTYTYTVAVTDTNGIQVTKSGSFEVQPYSYPVISNVLVKRYSEQNMSKLSLTGRYIYITATMLTAGTPSIKINGKYLTSITSSGSNAYTFKWPTLTESESLDMSFIVVDKYGGLTPYTAKASTVSYAIHILNGGTGVAVGTTAAQNKFTVSDGWAPMWGDYNMPRIKYSGSPPTSQQGVNGLLWLSPAGNTIGLNNIVYGHNPDLSNVHNGTIWLLPLPENAIIPMVVISDELPNSKNVLWMTYANG